MSVRQRIALCCVVLGVCISGLAVLAQPASAPATQQDRHVYRNSRLGFTFTLPADWKINEQPYVHSHYTDVFLTVNNKRAGLRIKEQEVGRGRFELNERTIASQMVAGEVHVEVSELGGPGPVTMRMDSVGEDLSKLLAEATPARGPIGMSTLGLRFFKRGHSFQVMAMMRDPVSPDDVQKVRSIIESWRFESGPVNDIKWAESIAYQQLPQNIREGEWPIPHDFGARPLYGFRSVEVQRAGSGYVVEFKDANVGVWRYVVSQDAKVAPTTQP